MPDCIRCGEETTPVPGRARPRVLCHACRMTLAHNYRQDDIEQAGLLERDCLVCLRPLSDLIGSRGPVRITCSSRCKRLLSRIRADTSLL